MTDLMYIKRNFYPETIPKKRSNFLIICTFILAYAIVLLGTYIDLSGNY